MKQIDYTKYKVAKAQQEFADSHRLNEQYKDGVRPRIPPCLFLPLLFLLVPKVRALCEKQRALEAHLPPSRYKTCTPRAKISTCKNTCLVLLEVRCMRFCLSCFACQGCHDDQHKLPSITQGC